ncbi:hypothetical protein BD410DRAFT_790212 [Rickenella mellea]|uniref:Uncharacterized protein n=1 Tax=Rickenella mellea TaxID=50990 RepID=A0A4Y7PZP9_9AGAM|nr:hypothetical protein BD410DRAFT_790212 [Rickenella mellea]
MSKLLRSALSGSDWKQNELKAYNILVQTEDAQTFFNRELLSIDHLDPNLLSTEETNITDNFAPPTAKFLAYLDRALRSYPGEESEIDDLVRSLLNITGYDEAGTTLRTRCNIKLAICGETNRSAKTDVCLEHVSSMILLLVHEDKTISGTDPEPQVIAEAIASFQENNAKREDSGQDVLDAMTVPCVTMVGTQAGPVFYKVPVTMELSECVRAGTYPKNATVVTRCAPPKHQPLAGMEDPDNRRIILQYYTTFREVAKQCWSQFIANM